MDIRPLARTKDLIVQETENEVLVYDLEKNTAICLNETAVCVWNSCDGKKSINELAQTLTDKKGKQVSTDIIWLALNQLKKEKLLVNGESLQEQHNGLTRRELVRNVGVTSLIALPVISSIVAPESIAAQSGGCMAGQCVPANTNACALCNPGQTITILGQTSGNGTCAGPGGIGSISVVCNPGGGLSAGSDVLITAVS